VWRDPQQPDTPVRITHPAPAWLAEVMAEPMTEEKAMERLALDTLPAHVLAHRGNRPAFVFVPRDQVPTDRTFRDAWEMAA
jgi:hypothetical protein